MVSNIEISDVFMGIKVGDKVFGFELKGIDGEMYFFENIKDGNGEMFKGFVVIFICNICFYVVMYEDCFIELYNKLVL